MTLTQGFEGPRGLKPGEARGLLRLLDRCFARYAKSGLRREYPQIYGRMEKFPSHHRVILRRGRIVAHVGVYPMKFVTPGGRVTAGGIGTVCTDGKFRGKGLMTDLMGEAVRWMKGEDMPLSILWGNRYRYRRFGWEPAGCRFGCSFSPQAAGLLSRFDLPAVITPVTARLAGDLYGLHQRMPYRLDMDGETFRLTILKVRRRVWTARDGRRPVAYAVAHEDRWRAGGKMRSGWSVDGWGGNVDGILSIIRAMLVRSGTDYARCVWPAGCARIPVPVLEAGNSWSSGLEYMGQLRINNLESVMTRLGAGDCLEKVRALGWNERAQARLLFGPMGPANLLSARQAQGPLGRRLPLGLFLDPIDAI